MVMGEEEEREPDQERKQTKVEETTTIPNTHQTSPVPNVTVDNPKIPTKAKTKDNTKPKTNNSNLNNNNMSNPTKVNNNKNTKVKIKDMGVKILMRDKITKDMGDKILIRGVDKDMGDKISTRGGDKEVKTKIFRKIRINNPGGYNNRGGEEYQEGHPQQQHRGGGRPRGANLSLDPKIVFLREKTQGYYQDETLFKVLEQFQGDVEQSLQHLNVSRQTSWSNVVAKTASHYGYQQSPEDGLQQDQADTTQVEHQEYYQPQRKPPRHRKNQIKAQEPVPPKEEEEVYNADEKIEEIQQALVAQLSAMESKTDELKRLQEEIRKIKADRDVQIEQLSTEKETLTLKFEQLKQDIEKTQHRIYAIDGEVTNLKQEKVDRIRSLEERTRVLLEDKTA